MSETPGQQAFQLKNQGIKFPQIKFRPLFMAAEQNPNQAIPAITDATPAVAAGSGQVDVGRAAQQLQENQSQIDNLGSRVDRLSQPAEAAERKLSPLARLKGWWEKRKSDHEQRMSQQRAPTETRGAARVSQPALVDKDFYDRFASSFTDSHNRDGETGETGKLAVNLTEDPRYKEMLANARKQIEEAKGPIAHANNETRLTPSEEARAYERAYLEYSKKFPEAVKAYEAFGLQFGEADAESKRKIEPSKDPFIISLEARVTSITSPTEQAAVWDDYVRKFPAKADIYARHGHRQIGAALERAKPRRQQEQNEVKRTDFVTQAKAEADRTATEAATAENRRIAKLAELQGKDKATLSLDELNELKALRKDLAVQIAEAKKLYAQLTDETNEKPLTPEELATVKKYEAVIKRKEVPPKRTPQTPGPSGGQNVDNQQQNQRNVRNQQGATPGEVPQQRARQRQNEAQRNPQKPDYEQARESIMGEINDELSGATPEARRNLFNFAREVVNRYRSDQEFRQAIDEVIETARMSVDALRFVTNEGRPTNGLDYRLLPILFIKAPSSINLIRRMMS